MGFAADAGAGKHGQGRTFVGATVAGPKGNFAARIGGVSAGAYITATAIDANGNTSEFSLNRQVQTARQLSGYASFLPLIRTK